MNIDEIKERLAKVKKCWCSITISACLDDIPDLIEAVGAAEKKSHEIWDALKEQTKELARAYTKIESLKEAVEARDKVIQKCKETIESVQIYVSGLGLSAEDDCDESLEMIKELESE